MTIRQTWTPLLVFGLVMATGCGSTVQESPDIACEKRPQVCTMRYAPVCARLQTGEKRTYSSPCNACADVNVKSYIAGGKCGQQAGGTGAVEPD